MNKVELKEQIQQDLLTYLDGQPMTFAELVDETVEYYTNNPRSLVRPSSGSEECRYYGPNGERCAAARLCDESATDFYDMDAQRQPSWNQVCHMAVLKPEYAHFTTEQIMDLQSLHDRDSYWLEPYGESGTGGLTVNGKEHAYNIKSRW